MFNPRFLKVLSSVLGVSLIVMLGCVMLYWADQYSSVTQWVAMVWVFAVYTGLTLMLVACMRKYLDKE